MGGVRDCIDPGMFVAGKTIAGTLTDLLTDPEELEKARQEFKERDRRRYWRRPVGRPAAAL